MKFNPDAGDVETLEREDETDQDTHSIDREVREAARRLSQGALDRGYKAEGLYEYRDIGGRPIYWIFCLKNSVTGNKWIRPMHKKGCDYLLKDPIFPEAGKPLYRLPELASRSTETVIMCEGEKCVDALIKLGVLASTNSGKNAVNKADLSILAGRNIKIWRDYDPDGLKYAKIMGKRLKAINCKVTIIDVSKLDLPPGGDVIDWLSVNSKATKTDIDSLPMWESPIICTDDSKEKKLSETDKLIVFVEDTNELFHDKNSVSYAKNKNTGEIRNINGGQFKDWLSASFYRQHEKAASDNSLREALRTLSGLARFDAECLAVDLRVAKGCKNNYYLDLSEPQRSRAVEIKAGSYEIIDTPPINFLRPTGILPLTEPIPGGDFKLLWDFVNIPNEAKLLVTTWLVDSLMPDTPCPVLELFGEHGSAKSATQAILRTLIDPVASPLNAKSKTIDDIFVNANGNCFVSYENMSHLTPAEQDAFCTIATGVSHNKRKLFTNADLAIIAVKRPIIINGISIVVTRQDLVDRCLSIELPRITNRLEMKEILGK